MSFTMAASCDLLVGLRLRRAVRGLREGTNDAAAGELDLEGVVRMALGVTQHEVGRARERGLVGGLPAQRCLGRGVAPGLVGDAAEGAPPLPDGAALELER